MGQSNGKIYKISTRESHGKDEAVLDLCLTSVSQGVESLEKVENDAQNKFFLMELSFLLIFPEKAALFG